MTLHKNYLLLMAMVILLLACQEDAAEDALDRELEATLMLAANSKDLSFFELPESDAYDRIPQDPRNELTAAKVKLGQLLFHESALAVVPMDESSFGQYSCASCHFAAAGFQAGVAQGIGEGGLGFGLQGEGRIMNPSYDVQKVDIQPIRSPTAMNTAYQELMLWNGQFGATGANAGTEAQWKDGTPIATNHLGFEGVETQAIAALGVHRQACVDTIMAEMGYQELFDAAFPDVPVEERYTNTTTGLAIAAYERTVLANRAPFQEWLKGDRAALTDQEKEGAILFFGRAECGTCHTGPALNEMDFHAIGMKDLHEANAQIIRTSAIDPVHFGRASFTKVDTDKFKFKVPQLYNLKDSPFYGHGSSFNSIQAVVEYKNEGKKENSSVPSGRLSEHFKPLQLTRIEVRAITAFIENGLYDPDLRRYEPDALLSGSCFPNNDPISRTDLGCE